MTRSLKDCLSTVVEAMRMTEAAASELTLCLEAVSEAPLREQTAASSDLQVFRLLGEATMLTGHHDLMLRGILRSAVKTTSLNRAAAEDAFDEGGDAAAERCACSDCRALRRDVETIVARTCATRESEPSATLPPPPTTEVRP